MSSYGKTQWLMATLTVIISLLSGYYSYFINPAKVLITDDGVKQWEERMEPVKGYLPAEIQEVGYISDNESSAIIQEYSLTRYSMVPIIVRQGSNYEWIIGNFTQPGFEAIIANNIDEKYEIKKFGVGIYLIHRINP